jgi:hypothetical protein
MRFVLVCFLLIAAIPAAAQTPGPGAGTPQTGTLKPITLTPAAAKRWDAGVDVASFTGWRSDLSEWDHSYNTGAVSLALGRFWTPHVKTGMALTHSGEGSLYWQQQIAVPGQSFPGFRYGRRYFQATQLSGDLTYQFFENAWVHPFLSAGVQASWERERLEVPSQRFGPVVLPAVESEERILRARPFAGGGVKFFVAPRAFVRTGLQFSFGENATTQMVAAVGLGFEF